VSVAAEEELWKARGRSSNVGERRDSSKATCVVRVAVRKARVWSLSAGRLGWSWRIGEVWMQSQQRSVESTRDVA
jgi:hypothetical protein